MPMMELIVEGKGAVINTDLITDIEATKWKDYVIEEGEFITVALSGNPMPMPERKVFKVMDLTAPIILHMLGGKTFKLEPDMISELRKKGRLPLRMFDYRSL